MSYQFSLTKKIPKSVQNCPWMLYKFVKSAPIAIKDSLVPIFLLNKLYSRYRCLWNCIGKLTYYIFWFNNNTKNTFLNMVRVARSSENNVSQVCDLYRVLITRCYARFFICLELYQMNQCWLECNQYKSLKSCMIIYLINET